MRRLSFTVPGPPQPKERARRGKGGRWYTPRKTAQYEDAVKGGAMEAAQNMKVRGHSWPADREYAVAVVCYFPDARTRDADNVLKSVQDALNKVLWGDDRQVRRAMCMREIDRANPRTEVTVEALEAVA